MTARMVDTEPARRGVSAVLVATTVLAGCGARPADPVAPTTEERIAIIGSERGPSGTRLVAIDEAGDRQFVVVVPGAGLARDANPTVSPDGRWVVFASSRDRALDQSSLWIAKVGVEQQPARLTTDVAIDSHPTWTSDGAAIVFASTRDGGDFDLWRLDVRDGKAAGIPIQLTSGPGHEVTPTVARDGAILYAAVAQIGASEIESHLELRAPDGAITKITDGPADTSPALSPDGTRFAFARPVVHATGPSSEVWIADRAGDVATTLVALPLTDESGPVWSHDGRFVFATSVFRGKAGVVFSSIVHVDLREAPARARMLVDRAGAVARLTPAIVTPTLDTTALHGDPEYLSELARIFARAIDAQRAQSEQPAQPSTPR